MQVRGFIDAEKCIGWPGDASIASPLGMTGVARDFLMKGRRGLFFPGSCRPKSLDCLRLFLLWWFLYFRPSKQFAIAIILISSVLSKRKQKNESCSFEQTKTAQPNLRKGKRKRKGGTGALPRARKLLSTDSSCTQTTRRISKSRRYFGTDWYHTALKRLNRTYTNYSIIYWI